MTASIAQRLGYDYHNYTLRKALCLSSFFTKPEYGIHGWEELSRSSAFFVRNHTAAHLRQLHVVSVAHVTHPFLYPKLYPEEYPRFLKFLSERDTRHAIQLRELHTGRVLEHFALASTTWQQEGTDLVILHLEHEKNFLDTLLSKYQMEIHALELECERLASSNTSLEMVGHDFTKDEQGNEVLVPASLRCEFKLGDSKRLMLSSVQPSVMGMCGGPVLRIGANTIACVGMVEARANISKNIANVDVTLEQIKSAREIDDTTIALRSHVIADYLQLVETKMCDVYEAERKGINGTERGHVDVYDARLEQNDLESEPEFAPTERSYRPGLPRASHSGDF